MSSTPNEPQFLQKISPINPFVDEGLSITLIGAGGNGGYLVPNLMRIISTMGVLAKRIELKVVDFDAVEAKNINRQLFIDSDIEKNKAEVLVKRYANAFHISPDIVGYIPQKLETPDQMVGMMSQLFTNVIIDCVDNTTARNVLYTGFLEHCATRISGANYLLSAGSGEWNGQIGIGGVRVVKDGWDTRSYIPTVYATHPEMIDPAHDAAEAALSCADRAAANVQSINANLTASTLLLNFMMPLFKALERCSNPAVPLFPWTTGIVYFNTKDNSFNQQRLTEDYLGKKNPAPHPVMKGDE